MIKPTRGGKRPGAGRPKKGTEKLSVRWSPAERVRWTADAKRLGRTLSDHVRARMNGDPR